MRHRAVDNQSLSRWRALDACQLLREIADYAKEDSEFRPRESARSTRWFTCVGGREYELLCTGPKFLDVRTGHGGGGAVDLVMYLCQTDFKGAVVLLRAKGL